MRLSGIARLTLSLACLNGTVSGEMQQEVRPALVGVWKVTRLEHEGVDLPHVARDLTLEFSETEIRLIQRSRETISVTFDIDETMNPGRFSWSMVRNQYVREQRGRYELDNNTLTICLSAVGSPRASGLETRNGDGRTLFVLQRRQPRVNPGRATGDTAQVLQLGVFVLSRDKASPIRQMIRLYVDHNGDVFGAAYDLEARQRIPLQGRIDQATQTVTWSVGETVMTVPLTGLTRNDSTVTIQRENQTEQWIMSFAFLPRKPDEMMSR